MQTEASQLVVATLASFALYDFDYTFVPCATLSYYTPLH